MQVCEAHSHAPMPMYNYVCKYMHTCINIQVCEAHSHVGSLTEGLDDLTV